MRLLTALSLLLRGLLTIPFASAQASSNGVAVVSIEPSQSWDGNDGPWSTFTIGVGSPLQYSKVLVSTTATQPWVVVPEGCTPQDPTDCGRKRGGLFRYNASTSWKNTGIYNLHVDQNLNLTGNGIFGFDTIAFGGNNAPVLSDQIVAGIATKDFYLANLGVHIAATNLSNHDPIPSWILNLKNNGSVASLSWAYTAGAWSVFSANKQGTGSLTIGGYDQARFQPGNDLSFSLSANPEKDLSVGLRNVAVGSTQLLSEAQLSFIDAGVSHIWLDVDSCKNFEKQFNLTWNETLNAYLFNESSSALSSSNENITFTLGNDLLPNTPSVTIDVPLRALVLNLTTSFPGVAQEGLQYFPLKRAANFTQYTLGRAFLQHAYVIADYERAAFFVHQAAFPGTGAKQLRAILPPGVANGSSGDASAKPMPNTGLSAGTLAGIAVGALVAAVILVLGLGLVLRRKGGWQRLLRRRQAGPRPLELDPEDKKVPVEADSKHELVPEVSDHSHHQLPELRGCERRPHELKGEGGRVAEAPGGWEGHEMGHRVEAVELDGKALDVGSWSADSKASHEG